MDNIYQKGQLYTIRSHQTDIFYIGSTTQALHQRLSGHRRDFKKWSADNENINFITSFEILKYEDHYIELLEIFPCNSKKELNKREGQHIRSQEKCVNKCIAGRTRLEWENDNKKNIIEYHIKYRDEHQEQIKKYRDENKEQNLEYQKQYYETNKDQILEKAYQTIECECGINYTKHHKSRHLKTKKHQTYLENNKSII
jgi:hypothetical protein